MLPSAMVSDFPSRVNDRGRARLDNAIASAETYSGPGLNQFDVSPLILMVMNVVRYFAEQNALVN